MGLFNKLKNVLFEEEEIDEEVDTPSEDLPVEKEVYEEVREYKPMPEHKEVVKPKEPIFEKVKTEDKDYSERELFKSETTFKFPAFDEEEFNTSMPKMVEEEHKSTNVIDYERKKREERRNEYSRFDSSRLSQTEPVKEEKKRFKPSPVISPVYGILDKDYKADDIVEATPNGGVVLTSKDLDVEQVRAKAFGKLKNITDDKKEKPVIVQETYEIKKEIPKEDKKEEIKVDDVIITDEPIIEDASKFMEERTKTIDELLKDASDEIIDTQDEIEDTLTDSLDLTEEYKKIEDELDSALDFTSQIEPVKEDDEKEEKDEKKSKHSSLENDTLENDLYDLIDSMYDNTEDGEQYMEFWLSFLPIIIYALIIIILVVGIILVIRSIRTVKKVEKVVDNVNDKVESLDEVFNVIDFTTDKIASLTDRIVDGVTGFFGKIFLSKKNNDKEDIDE